ncbi:efflux RND transporter periplasmic adaptor subunit [Mesorhizobium sp. VNQ89]|uniref:efflux RND transporter periplasmic adaptor subunit n=1 Tax=Mesorhizobium quangtriensis TaxID=3157709 RepID=UPI0032B730A5
MGTLERGASLIAALLLAGSAALAQEAAPAAPPIVETAAVKLASVTNQTEFVGSVVAAQQVALTSRVEGFLDSVNFTEGGFVQAGSTAFVIEKDTYQAALEGAQAQLASAQAAEAGAEANLKLQDINLQRQKDLLKTAAVSQSVVDQAQANRDSAAAQVDQAKAQILLMQSQLTTAQLNLSFTDIKTPITGRIGRAIITEGNLVSPSSGTLATVVQTDPIRVVFSISDREYLGVVKTLQPDNKGLAADAASFQPKLRLPDGTEYDQSGRIAFIDNTIDPSTGTIAVYAEFPNPQLKLVPNQFVQVTVQAGQSVELPVVPASAILQDQEGPYVFGLDEQNRAQIRRVTLGQRVGTDWAITGGLAQGEMVIVSGIQKVRPGIVVTPQPAGT